MNDIDTAGLHQISILSDLKKVSNGIVSKRIPFLSFSKRNYDRSVGPLP